MRGWSQRETLVRKVSIVPLEVIVRNIAAPSFSKRYGVPEGLVFEEPVLEFSYKNDALGDPLLQHQPRPGPEAGHPAEIDTIKGYALQIDRILQRFWSECGVTLAELQAGVRQDLGRQHHPGRRDQPRYLPPVGYLPPEKSWIRTASAGIWAAWEAYAEIMKRLVEHGCKLNRSFPRNTTFGKSVVSLAFSKEPADVASLAYYGLFALQHRGQESAGSQSTMIRVFTTLSGRGLVNEVFPKERLQRLGSGNIVVGRPLCHHRLRPQAQCPAHHHQPPQRGGWRWHTTEI